MDKSCYGKDEQPGSGHIELRYLSGDDTVVVHAVDDLSGDPAGGVSGWAQSAAARHDMDLPAGARCRVAMVRV